MRVPISMDPPKDDRFDNEPRDDRDVGYRFDLPVPHLSFEILGQRCQKTVSHSFEPQSDEFKLILRSTIQEFEPITIAFHNIVQFPDHPLELAARSGALGSR